MLTTTMPVSIMSYEEVKRHFVGGGHVSNAGYDVNNNGFISTMPLVDADYISPYDEPGHSHGVPYEQNADNFRASKAQQLTAFRARLHLAWHHGAHHQEFKDLITRLYSTANAHRHTHNIDRDTFDKEFILSLFSSSTTAYLGVNYPTPGVSCGQGVVERITMELSTYRYLEHFPQATKDAACNLVM